MMTLRLSTTFFLFFLVHFNSTAQTPFVCDGRYIVSYNNGLDDYTSDLLYFNINKANQTVSFDTIARDIPHRLWMLGYNRQDNLLYSIIHDNSIHTLIRLDYMGNVEYLDTLNISENALPISGGSISNNGNLFFLISYPTLSDSEWAQIDLSSPDYPLTILRDDIPQNILFGDIAIDPFTNIIYGYSIIEHKIFTFNPANLELIIDSFSTDYVPPLHMGPFFDAFGNLYGYNYGEINRTNKYTGEITHLFDTWQYNITDGCSCPYTLRMQAITEQDTVYPCTETDFTLRIANVTGEEMDSLTLNVPFPSGFIITDIPYQPYEGEIISAQDSNLLKITNMTLPPRLDSIVLSIHIPEDAEGLYEIQALLNNVDLSMNNDTATGVFSDYPFSDIQFDPTPLYVLPIDVEAIGEDIEICQDSSAFIGPQLPENGLSFIWNTGDTTQNIEVTEGGSYALYLSTACETDTVSYQVIEEIPSIELDRQEGLYFGDPVFLEPFFYSINPAERYLWTVSPEQYLECDTCSTLSLIPENDLSLQLFIWSTNGCRADHSVYIHLDKDVHAPNAFSPNDDGINDYFFIQSKNDVLVKNMQVFDRWGGLVYANTDFYTNYSKDGWDGSRMGEPLPEGIYVWMAELQFGSKSLNISGDVLLTK